jgi:hypothetical protein
VANCPTASRPGAPASLPVRAKYDQASASGLTDEFLADKQKFRDVAAELADFIRDAELVIHNASFVSSSMGIGLLRDPDMESAHDLRQWSIPQDGSRFATGRAQLLDAYVPSTVTTQSPVRRITRCELLAEVIWR